MANELLANNFSTTLAGNGGSITAGQTAVNVAAAASSGLQSGQFRVIVDAEIMIVTAGQSGTAWTVTRGAEGTTAVSHTDGAIVAHVITAGGLANSGVGSSVQIVQPSGDTTGVTDTANIQAALNAVNASGGGQVRLVAGQYYATSIQLRSTVDLHGAGRQATNVKVPVGQAANAHLVTLFDNTTYDYGLFDMTLDGGNGPHSNGVGGLQTNAFNIINLDGSTSSGTFGPYAIDNLGRLERLLVVNSSQHGVAIGTKLQEMRFRNVYAVNCLVNGWNVSGYDCFFADCTSGNSGQHGFALSGANLQFVNCKAWSSGQNNQSHQNDWNILTTYSTFFGCASEGAVGYGYSIGGTQNKVSGLVGGSKLAYVDIFQAVGCDVDILCTSQDLTYEPAYTLRVDGNPSTGRVTLRGSGNFTNAAAIQQIATTLAGLQIVIGTEDGGTQSIAYAATITPNPYNGSTVLVGALTAGITIANPSQGHPGTLLTLVLPQDATGGRTVTLGNAFKGSFTSGTSGGTANQTLTIQYVYDGTVWREVGHTIA